MARPWLRKLFLGNCCATSHDFEAIFSLLAAVWSQRERCVEAMQESESLDNEELLLGCHSHSKLSNDEMIAAACRLWPKAERVFGIEWQALLGITEKGGWKRGGNS